MKRRASGILGTLGFLMLVVLAPGANAHHAPETGGKSAWCHARISTATQGAPTVNWWLACRATASLAGSSGTFRETWWNGFGHWDEPMFDAAPDASDNTNFLYRWSGTGTHNAPAGYELETGESSFDVNLSGSHEICGPSPYGHNNTVTNTCTNGTDKVGLGGTGLTVGGTGYPPYPDIGGSMPPPPGALTCSVDLEGAAGVYRAEFKANASGATSWAWTFTPSFSSTQQNPALNYTTPANAGAPYTASVTATNAGGSVGPCLLSFDFYGPTHIDGDGGPVEPPDNCGQSPAVFDVVGWLKRLFLPCGADLSEAWTNVSDAATGNWPFAPLLYVGGAIDDFEDIDDGDAEGFDDGLVHRYENAVLGDECSSLRIPMEVIIGIEPPEEAPGDEYVDMLAQCETSEVGQDPTATNEDDAGDLWESIRNPLRTISRAVSLALAFTLGLAVIRNAADRATDP